MPLTRTTRSKAAARLIAENDREMIRRFCAKFDELLGIVTDVAKIENHDWNDAVGPLVRRAKAAVFATSTQGANNVTARAASGAEAHFAHASLAVVRR